MAYDGYRAALASSVKSHLRSGLKHPRRELRFGHENVQLFGGNFYARILFFFGLKFLPRVLPIDTKILLPGRILNGIPVSTDFSERILPKYASGIFPISERIPPEKRATLAGSRRVPGISAGTGGISIHILQGK